MHAVAADGVWKYFGDYPALRGASLEVAKGACVALIGRNGAGKSSTIKMLLGMIRPTSGTGTVLGYRIDDPKQSIAIRRRIVHIVSLVIETAVLCGLVLLFFCRTPQVDGRSMEPQVTDGEHVLIDTLAYDVRMPNPANAARPLFEIGLHPIARGDLVAFEMGTGDDRRILLKRVAGLPGDSVPVAGAAPVVVPPGDLYVLGDNRAESVDSRSFGPIPIASVVGRATFVVWPLTRVRALR